MDRTAAGFLPLPPKRLPAERPEGRRPAPAKQRSHVYCAWAARQGCSLSLPLKCLPAERPEGRRAGLPRKHLRQTVEIAPPMWYNHSRSFRRGEKPCRAPGICAAGAIRSFILPLMRRQVFSRPFFTGSPAAP